MIGVKYFGIAKYFFRLDYTSGVESVPLCAVHWIHLLTDKNTINCVIGRITAVPHTQKKTLKPANLQN